MTNHMQDPPCQKFLELLNEHIARRENERQTTSRSDESGYRIRDLLETEITLLHIIRNEYRATFKEYLSQ